MRCSFRSALFSSPRGSLTPPATNWAAAAVFVGGMLLALMPAAAVAGDIAVVVHPEVRVENITFTELRKILLGDRQFWPSGQPVTLIVRAPVAAERTLLLKKVYGMSEAQFRQYWIAKVFRAEATSSPHIVVSNSESVELVGALAGAIVLVDAEDVPSGLKILQIDGRRPGERDYALKPIGIRHYAQPRVDEVELRRRAKSPFRFDRLRQQSVQRNGNGLIRRHPAATQLHQHAIHLLHRMLDGAQHVFLECRIMLVPCRIGPQQ